MRNIDIDFDFDIDFDGDLQSGSESVSIKYASFSEEWGQGRRGGCHGVEGVRHFDIDIDFDFDFDGDLESGSESVSMVDPSPLIIETDEPRIGGSGPDRRE